MSEYPESQKLPIAAMVVGIALVIAICLIRLSNLETEDEALPPPIEQKLGTLDSKLARCRTVTADQTTSLDYCRRVWAEQRRRFLGQSGSSNRPHGDDALTGVPSDLPSKDQSRLPQGYPAVAEPESE